MRFEITVNDCRDCPFRKKHVGHGECWYYCDHPNHGRESYADILWGCGAEYKAVPEWCPGRGKPSPVLIRPGEFCKFVEGKEDVIGFPVVMSVWPTPEGK